MTANMNCSKYVTSIMLPMVLIATITHFTTYYFDEGVVVWWLGSRKYIYLVFHTHECIFPTHKLVFLVVLIYIEKDRKKNGEIVAADWFILFFVFYFLTLSWDENNDFDVWSNLQLAQYSSPPLHRIYRMHQNWLFCVCSIWPNYYYGSCIADESGLYIYWFSASDDVWWKISIRSHNFYSSE